MNFVVKLISPVVQYIQPWRRVYHTLKGGHWLLDWTTGLVFKGIFNHKNPLTFEIDVSHEHMSSYSSMLTG